MMESFETPEVFDQILKRPFDIRDFRNIIADEDFFERETQRRFTTEVLDEPLGEVKPETPEVIDMIKSVLYLIAKTTHDNYMAKEHGFEYKKPVWNYLPALDRKIIRLSFMVNRWHNEKREDEKFQLFQDIIKFCCNHDDFLSCYQVAVKTDHVFVNDAVFDALERFRNNVRRKTLH